MLIISSLSLSDETLDPDLASFASCVNSAWSSGGIGYVFPIGKSTRVNASSARRSLISSISSGSTKRSISGGTQKVSFNGYQVPLDTGIRYNLIPTWHSDLSRSVDPRRSNLVLSGLYLHLTRRPAVVSPVFPYRFFSIPQATLQECSTSRFSSLVGACQQSKTWAANASLPITSVQSFGTDPAFNSLSSLYNPTLNASDWFNISSSNDVNVFTGLPYAFQHHPVKGYPDGFPLLISAYTNKGRMLDTLRMMIDASYFDSYATAYATIEMLTYNRLAKSFGFFSGTFQWLKAGQVQFSWSFVGLPALSSFSWDESSSLPLVYVALVIAYSVATAWFLFNALYIEKKSRWTRTGELNQSHGQEASRGKELGELLNKDRKTLTFFEEKNRQLLESYNHTSWKPATGWFSLIVELLIISLMVSSVVVYFLYVNRLGGETSVFRSKYSAYDADSSAPCRYHLLQRSRSNTTNPAQYPGQPGTWALPANSTELDGVTSMLTQASNLEYLWSTYEVIVSAIILLMMINLIRLVGFQPRLSVIPAALHMMMEDLFHLLIVFVVIALPLSVLVVILVGPFTERASNLGNAFVSILTMFVTGAGIEGPTEAINIAVHKNNSLTTIMAIAIYAALFFIVFIVIWVLRYGMVLVIIM
jgi:hypothetical protein